MGADTAGAVVELRRIVKRFPGVLANDEVDLALYPGEVTALVGENGAGKSTLVKILSGLESPDAGEVMVDGRRRSLRTPLQAIAAGIGTVHQHFMLFPSLSVAENIAYGQEPRRRGLFDADAAIAHVDRLARQYGLAVDPRAQVADLPVGLRQRVEILKALTRGPRLLILDEPTAVLTPDEVDQLFTQIPQITATGTAVLFVTHKLREVMAVSRRVTVLRHGRVVGRPETASTSPNEIVRLMVGGEAPEAVERGVSRPGPERLRLEDARVLGPLGNRAVDGLDITVAGGEIVGVAGVAGNGQSELIEGIVGLRPLDRGRVFFDGRDVSDLPTRERRALGLSYVPEDRNREGIARAATLTENVAIGAHRRPPLAHWGLLRYRTATHLTAELIRRFDIRAVGPAVAARTLSGGNAQKLIVARELGRRPAVLLAAEPTRGVDVGAIAFIHRQLLELRDAGAAVLLVSSELSEIQALADRALVLLGGRVAGWFDPRLASREEIGTLMAGGHSGTTTAIAGPPADSATSAAGGDR